MNRSIPILLAGLLVAVLAAEGKLSALWGAVIKNNRPAQPIGAGTYPGGPAPTSGGGPAPTNGGTSPGTTLAPGSAIDPLEKIKANHKFALANPGVDPVFDKIRFDWPASSDPSMTDLFNEWISCYLAGSDATTCVQRLPRSPFG